MKTALLALAVALTAATGTARASHAEVDTPWTHYSFDECPPFEAVAVERLGSVITVIAFCTQRTGTPQSPTWKPVEDPDGGVLWWNSRLRLDSGYSFQRCEVTLYRNILSDETLFADCLDDPYVPSLAGAR